MQPSDRLTLMHFYDIIYSHHERHGAGNLAALDIGAGVGFVAAKLLWRFEHVTLSDSSELYLSQAKQAFGSSPASRVSFLHSSAETVSLDALPGSQPVDLITAGTCLHWTDLDVCIPRFASMLKPNGTFAAWVYGGRPLVAGVPDPMQLQRIVGDIFDRFGQAYEARIEKQRDNSAAAIINARFDNIHLDYGLWKDVRRIHANKAATMMCDWWPVAASQVGSDDSMEELEDGAFLSREVDYEWLEKYLSNLIPVIDLAEVAEDQLTQLRDAMAGRTVQLRWSFVLVLATKK